jgi:hypothetical protein
LTAKTQEENKTVSHYLTLAAGSEVHDNKKIKMKVPVPYLSSPGSLVRANWKVRRLDIVIDELASNDIVFNLYSGNKKLITDGRISSNKEHESFEMFEEILVYTGEFLQIECVNSSGSNYWSAYLLIDLL